MLWVPVFRAEAQGSSFIHSFIHFIRFIDISARIVRLLWTYCRPVAVDLQAEVLCFLVSSFLPFPPPSFRRHALRLPRHVSNESPAILLPLPSPNPSLLSSPLLSSSSSSLFTLLPNSSESNPYCPEELPVHRYILRSLFRLFICLFFFFFFFFFCHRRFICFLLSVGLEHHGASRPVIMPSPSAARGVFSNSDALNVQFGWEVSVSGLGLWHWTER